MVYCGVTSPYLSPLTQQKVMTQAEAVEIAMHLEATPGGAETSTGLVQVQSQLANLMMQLQDMAKIKSCMSMYGVPHVAQKGHHRDEVPCPSKLCGDGCTKSISIWTDRMV
jgi:hypothetical protein